MSRFLALNYTFKRKPLLNTENGALTLGLHYDYPSATKHLPFPCHIDKVQCK